MDFSSASPSCRLHRPPATSLQKQRATVWVKEGIKTVLVSRFGLPRGPSGRCMGRAITTRPWLFLWGGMNQLVLSVASPTLSLLSIWLWVTVVPNTHTHTDLYRLCSHLSSNAHMLTLIHNYQPFTQTHLSHTCTDCGVCCRLEAKCSKLPIMY